MNLRKASPEDLPAVAALYQEASAFLRSQGIDQWQDGYPNGETFLKDVARDQSWVGEERGQVLATACLAYGREPTYDVIHQGTWAVEAAEYGFLHRIAVAGSCKGQGVPGLFFRRLEEEARRRGLPCLRADTHQDNKIMRRVLEKNGFQPRGVILLEDGSPRLAFEKPL